MVNRIFIEGNEGQSKIFKVQIINNDGGIVAVYFEVYGPGGDLKNCFATEVEAKMNAEEIKDVSDNHETPSPR